MTTLECGHPAELLTKSVESDYQFCELCEARSRARDAEAMEAELREQLKHEEQSRPVRCRMFAIRLRGRQLYWTCSSEHGSGWHPRYPKQAFSKSELAQQIMQMIEHRTFTDCEIVELSMPKWTTEGEP